MYKLQDFLTFDPDLVTTTEDKRAKNDSGTPCTHVVTFFSGLAKTTFSDTFIKDPRFIAGIESLSESLK